MTELNKKEKESAIEVMRQLSQYDDNIAFDHEQAAKKFIEKLSRTSNNMAFDHELFAQELANNFKEVPIAHTKGMLFVLCKFISEVSEFNTDLRNEAAIKWCKEVKEKEKFFQLNIPDDNHKEFAALLADNFRREHRTLQQGIIKVLAEFIGEVSEFSTEQCNEEAINWCKEVKKIEAFFPFI